jgi:hypothetical protein
VGNARPQGAGAVVTIARVIDQPAGTPRMRSLGFGVLTLATLVAWAPLASLLTGALLGAAVGCSGNEGSRPSCVVAGVDVGAIIYGLTFAGWLILGVWPLMLVTLLAWSGVLVWTIVGRLRRLRKAR